jgi:hypothetical protein
MKGGDLGGVPLKVGEVKVVWKRLRVARESEIENIFLVTKMSIVAFEKLNCFTAIACESIYLPRICTFLAPTSKNIHQ